MLLADHECPLEFLTQRPSSDKLACALPANRKRARCNAWSCQSKHKNTTLDIQKSRAQASTLLAFTTGAAKLQQKLSCSWLIQRSETVRHREWCASEANKWLISYFFNCISVNQIWLIGQCWPWAPPNHEKLYITRETQHVPEEKVQVVKISEKTTIHASEIHYSRQITGTGRKMPSFKIWCCSSADLFTTI